MYVLIISCFKKTNCCDSYATIRRVNATNKQKFPTLLFREKKQNKEK